MNIREIHAEYGDKHVVVRTVKTKLNDYGFFWADVTTWGRLIAAEIQEVINV